MTIEALNHHRGLIVDLKRTEAMRDSIECSDHGPGLSEEVYDLNGQLAELRLQIARAEPEILRFVRSAPDPQTRTILRLRFIRGYSWGEVAEIIGGRNTEENVKKVCYRYLTSTFN